MHSPILMHQTMRWFGPNDPVKLSDIRQAGCAGVVTALHHIPVGELWTVDEIQKRCTMIEEAGMTWTVIESLPVSEDIKKHNGNYQQHIENYKQSLINVAQCGLKVVTYNFMPILDWIRTNIDYRLPDGSSALYFERDAFVAFDIFLLKRANAINDYSEEEVLTATLKYESMTEKEKTLLFKNCLLGLPGSDIPFTPEEVHAALATYAHIDEAKLRENLVYFLKEVIPIAEANGLVFAIHPDDPPYAVIGLPRIMSKESDVDFIIGEVPSLANGLCFCTGSFGARSDNNLPHMLNKFADRVHFLHIRNTKRDGDKGNFYEADHLAGDTDIVAVISTVLDIQKRRNISIPMRPDHGHQMLDDLGKKTYPGYSAIGRLKGLAELRGVEYALSKM
jgi:mannonate dehydratase